jgi:hypothetical protein
MVEEIKHKYDGDRTGYVAGVSVYHMAPAGNTQL